MDEKAERVIRIDLNEFKLHIRLKNKTDIDSSFQLAIAKVLSLCHSVCR